ncbi:CrcB-like protein [Tritrichomonas foetus]|uniref:CrcB-like protein n=1 Tax=Tritrichomonas foetus TaxID=1144522 RepID=A0A1J4KKR5_9EUKA|nr:CrcB-like protein [Tritrichomonas foetus]|eukprot:OHT11819.1 CrcB-like protein [Tritrichomonas foetus]
MVDTLIANYLGCFIGGFLMPFSKLNGWVKYGMSFLSVGFCGSLTTFGGFAYSSLIKLENPKKALIGVGEIFAIIAGCLLFVSAGFYFSEKLVFPQFSKLHQNTHHHSKDNSNNNDDEEEERDEDSTSSISHTS